MRSASEFHRRSVENLRRRWRFVFQSPAAKRFEAITARSSAGRRGAEEVAALQGQIQALQIELENPSHALALLRPRRERPHSRTAEERDELAPSHAQHRAFLPLAKSRRRWLPTGEGPSRIMRLTPLAAAFGTRLLRWRGVQEAWP